MGILDWFKNRPAQFDPDRVSEETLRKATEKAITLTNPRLQVLPSCHKRLVPAVETTIQFLSENIGRLPPARPLSAACWASDPALRAFFVNHTDVGVALGRSENLRTLFDKFQDLEEAFLVLGMAYNEQRIFGMALQGDMVQRDVAQVSLGFSDHRTHLCSRDESRLRRLIGTAGFEYLLAQALSAIVVERAERADLVGTRALLGARLRLLQQQGPGFGSIFAAKPEHTEQSALEAELLKNERSLADIGVAETALEMELECVKTVLQNPDRYLQIEQRNVRLNTTNVVVDDGGEAADVVFSLADFKGSQPRKRAFVLARVVRDELPPVRGIDFDDAARYL